MLSKFNISIVLGLLGLLLLITQCAPPEISAPRLDRLDPTEGSVGEVVIIWGEFMHHTTSVILDGEELNFSPGQTPEEEIFFIIPESLELGDHLVYVESVSGKSNTLNLKVINPRPIINSVNLEIGMPGDSVKVCGEHLQNSGLLIELLGQRINNFTYDAQGCLLFTVPEGLTTSSGELIITVDGRSDSRPFSVRSSPTAPIIQSIIPSVTAPLDTIKIFGESLLGNELKVIFTPSIETDVLEKSDTLVKVIVPVDAENGSVKLIVDGVETNEFSIVVVRPENPLIGSIAPSTASIGDTVEINGQNFGAAADVVEIIFSDNKQAEIVSRTPQKISTIVPADAITGEVKVKVNELISSGFSFTIIPLGLPSISSISPDSAAQNTLLSINGVNLDGANQNIVFQQGGVRANGNIVTASPDLISANLPQANFQLGKVEVWAEIDGDNSDTLSFDFVPPPSIALINGGNSVNNGAIIEIQGENFIPSINNPVKVFFSSTGATEGVITGRTNTKIDVRVPIDAITGVVRILTPYGEVSDSIFLQSLSKISAVQPSNNAPNYPILIYGENLDQVNELKFGNLTVNTGFQYSAACNCLGGNIPDGVGLGNLDIRTGVNGSFSSPFAYNINANLPAVSAPGSPVILPTPPPGVSMGSFQNGWIVAYGPGPNGPDSVREGRFALAGDIVFNSPNADGFYVIVDEDNNNDTVGFFSEFGDTSRLVINNQIYIGKQNSVYMGDSVYYNDYQGFIPNMVYTPLNSGKQVELVFPGILTNVAVASNSTQYILTIRGKYFLRREFDPLFPIYSESGFYEFTSGGNTISIPSFGSNPAEIDELIWNSYNEIVLKIKKSDIPPGTYDFSIDVFGGFTNDISIMLP
ncbi:MAG: IPT/TIG domain-containing protein [Bacteroidia bacterium]|nr:IPT/TIG domain-containing protein [Bacteroidia bacterium]